MALGHFNSTITTKTQTSGISKLPSLYKYPQLAALDDVSISLIKNRLVYVVRHYGLTGISIMILRNQKTDQVTVICGDWNGMSLDLEEPSSLTKPLVEQSLTFIEKSLPTFITAMRGIRLDQAQLFLANNGDKLVLVDIQLTATRLAGPGMLRDIFANIYPTQEVLKVEAVDDRMLEYLGHGSGSYGGDVILKLSKFSTYNPKSAGPIPLYVEVKH